MLSQLQFWNLMSGSALILNKAIVVLLSLPPYPAKYSR